MNNITKIEIEIKKRISLLFCLKLWLDTGLNSD